MSRVEVIEDAQAERPRLHGGDRAWLGQLRIGYAIEGSRTGILRPARIEAGQAMNRALLAPYTRSSGRPARHCAGAAASIRSSATLIESDGPFCFVGESCEITGAGGRSYSGEIIGFRGSTMLSMSADQPQGIRFGDQHRRRGVHDHRFGSVLECSGA